MEKEYNMRRLFEEMTFEKDMVNNSPKYTSSYKEGYEEAVRCMGVIIKELTGQDVREKQSTKEAS